MTKMSAIVPNIVVTPKMVIDGSDIPYGDDNGTVYGNYRSSFSVGNWDIVGLLEFIGHCIQPTQ